MNAPAPRPVGFGPVPDGLTDRGLRMSDEDEPRFLGGGRWAGRLADVTDDLSALDSRGFWAVAITFEGAVTCARFDDVRHPEAIGGRAWHGPRIEEWESSLDRAAYEAAVETIRARIAAGEIYQANLCRVLSAPLSNNAQRNITGLRTELARGNPSGYDAVLRLPEHRVHIATASPELFLRREGRVVESAPIKGTAKRAEGLLDKDRAENVMIVDLVRNDLGRVCEPGSVSVPALCEVKQLPTFVHLESTVRGELRPDVGWAELIDATFPPGSVTGAPKIAALDVIRELEPVPRGPYCGAVGWVDADSGTGCLAVGIRTFWIADGRLHFGTGAGITWGSDPAAEWAETELKAARLLKLAEGESRRGPR